VCGAQSGSRGSCHFLRFKASDFRKWFRPSGKGFTRRASVQEAVACGGRRVRQVRARERARARSARRQLRRKDVLQRGSRTRTDVAARTRFFGQPPPPRAPPRRTLT
jgi:hypothetical protein